MFKKLLVNIYEKRYKYIIICKLLFILLELAYAILLNSVVANLVGMISSIMFVFIGVNNKDVDESNVDFIKLNGYTIFSWTFVIFTFNLLFRYIRLLLG